MKWMMKDDRRNSLIYGVKIGRSEELGVRSEE
jgi:hypothetical protein